MMNKIQYLSILLFFLTAYSVSGQQLNEKLKNLEPLLANNWVGDMKSPDGKSAYKVYLSYEPLWNGEAIKFSRSIPDIRSFSEGYIYWDNDSNKILVFSIATRGATRESEVYFEDGKIIMQGKLSIDKRIFDYKNTFEFTPDGKMIDTWFQNAFGQWQAGHIIEFYRDLVKL